MSEMNATLAVLLPGLAAASATLGLVDLGIAAAARRADRWRDPSPRLFRMLLPIARPLAAELQPERWFAVGAHGGALERAGLGYVVLPGEWIMLRALMLLLSVPAAVLLQPLLAGIGADGPGSMLLGVLLGGVYPSLWLRDQGLRRQKRIARQFPALLELLGLSVRAGLSFSAALPQCSAHLDRGPLREEMQRVDREIRTGVPRLEALERMAGRVDLNALHGFVAAIAQAEETGAAISQTLTDQAAQRRRERFAAAEKKANEAPVKMLAPLVGLLFPVTFLIIGFPIVMQFLDGGLL